jgi:hypothetical protein
MADDETQRFHDYTVASAFERCLLQTLADSSPPCFDMRSMQLATKTFALVSL